MEELIELSEGLLRQELQRMTGKADGVTKEDAEVLATLVGTVALLQQMGGQG